jgi:RNA polymerase sigma-70 factor, ECF subfamily
MDDLTLTSACARGDPQALRLFDDRYLSRLPGLLGRVRLSPAELDELKQKLREHLLLPRAGRGPRIGDFEGRAPLSSWLRVAAVRLALNLRRDQARHGAETASMDGQPAVILDPELAAIRRRFGDDFGRALRDAFASLQPRERNLLRLHFVERLGIDALASVLQVSRATAARHLAAAREALVERTILNLRSRLRLAPAELDSLVAQVRSKLEISLGALLHE